MVRNGQSNYSLRSSGIGTEVWNEEEAQGVIKALERERVTEAYLVRLKCPLVKTRLMSSTKEKESELEELLAVGIM